MAAAAAQSSQEEPAAPEPDMQAFPLLRPDRIASLPDHWLERSQMQILPLIDTLAGVSWFPPCARRFACAGLFGGRRSAQLSPSLAGLPFSLTAFVSARSLLIFLTRTRRRTGRLGFSRCSNLPATSTARSLQS